MFVVEGDVVRRRTVEDGFTVNETIADVPGCYLVSSHRLNLRTLITFEILRGSGSPLPLAVANWLGVKPGIRRSFQSGDEQVTVSWPESATSGPTLGSIRKIVTRHGCEEGDIVLLCFANDEMTAELLPVSTTDLEHATRTKRLAMLTGLPVTGNNITDQGIVKRALGQQCISRSIASILRSRGDHDIANLINETIPQELDKAIDELGKVL